MPDFQLTDDDPMLEQVEAATSVSGGAAEGSSAPAATAEAGGAEGRPPAVEPGEPSSAQFEPDASQ